MSLWRSILRWFGLYREARVQITAPGIEVTLAGDPTQVRALMGVIRTELERKARRGRRQNQVPESQVVRPTELDEMDSPYALPEAVVMPVPDDERPDERRSRLIAMSSQEPPTWPPAMSSEDVHQSTSPQAQIPLMPAVFTAEDVEGVRTALTSNPAVLTATPGALTPNPAAPTPKTGALTPNAAALTPHPVAMTAHPADRPTPPMAKGVSAVTSTEVATVEVDRSVHRVTRPLHPTVKPSEPVDPA